MYKFLGSQADPLSMMPASFSYLCTIPSPWVQMRPEVCFQPTEYEICIIECGKSNGMSLLYLYKTPSQQTGVRETSPWRLWGCKLPCYEAAYEGPPGKGRWGQPLGVELPIALRQQQTGTLIPQLKGDEFCQQPRDLGSLSQIFPQTSPWWV
jgi:hypothetical protein